MIKTVSNMGGRVLNSISYQLYILSSKGVELVFWALFFFQRFQKWPYKRRQRDRSDLYTKMEKSLGCNSQIYKFELKCGMVLETRQKLTSHYYLSLLSFFSSSFGFLLVFNGFGSLFLAMSSAILGAISLICSVEGDVVSVILTSGPFFVSKWESPF